MSEDPYVYVGTTVLRNKFNIRDAEALDATEREHTTARARSRVPKGGFDLAHLKAIHRHLFQDIYEWAGEIRTVEIAKGGHQFQFRRYIATGMADVRGRLSAERFLRGLPAPDFASQAAGFLVDVNYCHPFREGNGRVQLLWLKQLAAGAGHRLDLVRLSRAGDWIAASKASFAGDTTAMAGLISAGLGKPGTKR